MSSVESSWPPSVAFSSLEVGEILELDGGYNLSLGANRKEAFSIFAREHLLLLAPLFPHHRWEVCNMQEDIHRETRGRRARSRRLEQLRHAHSQPTTEPLVHAKATRGSLVLYTGCVS